MQYWLIKSEADEYSIDDLERDGKVAWEGVRNFTARNFMKNDMKIGDFVFFYHTNVDMGIYGLAKVLSKSHPDLSAQDKKSDYYDSKATKANPIWYCVDFGFVKKFKNYLSLPQIKSDFVLSDMMIVKRGRLSVTPVSEKQYKRVLKLLE
jgi:predicted RNA-binding protein with PUA-like domain